MRQKFSTAPGQVYSSLTVIAWAGEYSRVQCVCGTTKLVRNDKLKDGTTKSCGCLAASKKKKPPPALAKPTKTKDEQRLRAVHNSMMQRCYNQNNEDYLRYGGRGVTVCMEWHDKDAFVAALLPTYSKGKWLERKDNSIGYTPGNVVWASPKRQGRNRSNTLFVDNDGTKIPLPTAAAHWGLPYGVAYRLYSRYKKAGEELPMAALRRDIDRWRKRCYIAG